jgi:excisionase family DNA binding protein
MTSPSTLSHQPSSETAASTPLLLTVEQAAERLNVGRTLMFALIRDGQIESVQVGRLRRIRPAALAAFTERLATHPATPAA